MSLNWPSIVENVVAALVWVYSWLRNLLLERQLTEALNPNGAGVRFDPQTRKAEFTLQIHNYANATIRVRSIVFVAERFHVELRPAHDKPLFQTPLSNEVVRPRFGRKHLAKGSLEPDNNPHSMLLPPKTMGIWEVAPASIGQFAWVIKEIFMVFEYATVFGNSALVRIKASDATLRLVKDNFESLARALHNNEPYELGPSKRT